MRWRWWPGDWAWKSGAKGKMSLTEISKESPEPRCRKCGRTVGRFDGPIAPIRLLWIDGAWECAHSCPMDHEQRVVVDLEGIPLEIKDAATRLHHYFAKQGIKTWALMNVQSRDM